MTLAFPTSSVPWWRRMLTGLFSRQSTATMAVSADDRANVYDLNQAMYDNTVYTAWSAQVLNTYFPTSPPNDLIRGYWNPVKQIVDVYLNCLPGVFGDGTEIDPMFDGQPVNPKLIDPVRRVWRDSNLDSLKNVIQQHAANLGTVGLRPVVIDGVAMIQADHPARLFNIEEDGQGNVTAVVLKYQTQRNQGSLVEPDFQTVDVVEIITKDEFSQKIDGIEQLTDRVNRFGFCPYVILRHRDNGTWLGDHAYKGSESIIHAINYRITQQDRSIGRHMFPKWFGAMSGDKPTSIDIGEAEKMIYARMLPDSPPPILQAIVPQVNQDATGTFISDRITNLLARNPEAALSEMKLFANLSGEALLQAMKKVESCVLNVRPRYDHAIIRGVQMCLSMGMSSGNTKYDVGAGTGEGSGDRAYNDGLEQFQFASRPALPLTPTQTTALATASVADKASRLAVATAAQKIGVSDAEALRLAGYTQQQIDEIGRENRTQDVVPTQSL